MKITMLGDIGYAESQLRELEGAYNQGKLDRDEFIRELRLMQEEGLIDIRDLDVDDMGTILQADGDEQASKIMLRMNGDDGR